MLSKLKIVAYAFIAILAIGVALGIGTVVTLVSHLLGIIGWGLIVLLIVVLAIKECFDTK